MILKTLGASLALLCSVSGSAQTVAPAAPATLVPAEAVPAATVSIVMTTSEGPITLALEKERAPLTTANFLRYVDQKRLDGVTFYRAMNLGQGTGLIQGGPQNDPKRILKPVVHEPTSKTGLSHIDGTISLARLAPGTATADFFITVGPVLSLDANPTGSGDTAGYAAFGHVVEGMDVVKRILAAPISATAGVGVMKGQMIAAPVKILMVRRAK
ncbi:peptidylprolyl isomerase [Sphingomonas faeni]|uniref:peptidylprolyl isomerase n=1 Tax=Sphingomonas faeni TaxID=185950 RepID=UPI002413BB3D|nr:peptidylprolyl isomerase [Sphingomonas faeni]